MEVLGLTDIKAIGAGYYHSLAVKEDGTVLAWGNNASGQLGIGSQMYKITPYPLEQCDIKVENRTEISVRQNEKYTIELKELAENSIYTISYDSEYFELEDLCADTEEKETTPGSITGNISILEVKPGKIVLQFLTRTSGELNTGMLNSILLRAQKTGNTYLDFQNINDMPEYTWFDAQLIEDDSVTESIADNARNYDWYTFVANGTGTYTFYTTSSGDTIGELYTEEGVREGVLLTSNDNNGLDLNFRFTYMLAAGERYYLKVQHSGLDTGKYFLHIESPRQSWDGSGIISIEKNTNEEFTVAVSANNIRTFGDLKFRVIYDSAKLEVLDLCAQNFEKIIGIGQAGNVLITSYQPGDFRFEIVDMSVADGQYWSGVLNLLHFRFVGQSGEKTDIEIQTI